MWSNQDEVLKSAFSYKTEKRKTKAQLKNLTRRISQDYWFHFYFTIVLRNLERRLSVHQKQDLSREDNSAPGE